MKRTHSEYVSVSPDASCTVRQQKLVGINRQKPLKDQISQGVQDSRRYTILACHEFLLGDGSSR